MDNSRQITKKIDWLDEQRRKYQKQMAELQERLRAALEGNQELKARVTVLEGEAVEAREFLNRVNTLDDLIELHNSGFISRFEAAEAMRTKSEREGERLRQLERESINKSLTELAEDMSSLVQLREDMDARKEEEYRARADISEIHRSIESVTRSLEESEHLISNIHESRRLDSKRLSEFSSATGGLRGRMDELKSKLESLQDASIRNDKRITELTALETERQIAQSGWMEQQAVTHAERERWWTELQRKSAEIETLIEDSARKLEAFGETHRGMKQALSALDENIERIDRRLADSAEAQRLNHDRLQDEWNTFVADDQTSRAADLLLRDEKWREHDRKEKQTIVRIETLEDADKTTAQLVKHLRSMDQERLKTVFSIIREFMSEYDQNIKKVP